VRAYVGVTDNNWYRFLADRPGVTEVNFWQPSGTREFRVLAPGEPFFFKTHYPDNRVVGGGFFSDSARLRVSEAWEFFGDANGVASVEEMRARIRRPNSHATSCRARATTWPTLRWRRTSLNCCS
jgi:putative restriction endonuclease